MKQILSDRDRIEEAERHLSKLTPLEQACAEIRALCMRADLIGKLRLDGGELSAEELAENENKRAELARLRREIIIKHGVQEHFLAELRRAAHTHRAELARIEDAISKLTST